MNDPKIYSNKAKYYDYIYGNKDYRSESSIVHKIISKHNKSESRDLLDAGCGTGNHVNYLSKYYNCTGIDVSPEFIKIASQKVINAKFIVADMQNFQLSQQFAVVTCLFSAIGYCQSIDGLNKTMKNFYAHVKHGGLIIIEPWFTKQNKNFQIDKPFMTTYETDTVAISRISIATIEESKSIMETHYLVGEKNEGIHYFSEKHSLSLFDQSQYADSMTVAGFTPIFLSSGLSTDERGLFVGIKK